METNISLEELLMWSIPHHIMCWLSSESFFSGLEPCGSSMKHKDPQLQRWWKLLPSILIEYMNNLCERGTVRVQFFNCFFFFLN